MTHQVIIAKPVQKELDSLPDKIYENIREVLSSLKNNPRPNGCKKLRGTDSYRVRVGNYRIIYEVNDSISQIIIIHVGHRKEIYRRL